jgi:methionyl-tRNA formyltransferase
MARIVFMGTPEFAIPTLLALDEHHAVVGVVTQPDRKAGRGRKLIAPPVKRVAQELGLPITQPRTLGEPEAMDQIAEWQPDLIVVAAFGQILKKPVLTLPPRGCLNVHASLLPRHRGAAPIAAAILAGEEVTGVTIMHMDEGMDTGPILAQAECAIGPKDTAATLSEELAKLGAELLVDTLPAWLSGHLEAQPQDDSQASYCRPLRKKDGHLDWSDPAEHLERQVRAYDPWPGTYTTWQGQRLNVTRAQAWPNRQEPGYPGEVVELEGGVGVVTGQGVLELMDVQLAGKRPMEAELFARGQRGLVGSRLGA